MFQAQFSNKVAALGTIADLISPVNSQLFGLILILLINLSEQAEKRATRSNLARYTARRKGFSFNFLFAVSSCPLAHSLYMPLRPLLFLARMLTEV